MNDRWIPIWEDVPETDDSVLVTANGKHNNITFENALMIGCYNCTSGWVLDGYLDWIDPNVTAWMPLPEPYKKGDEDD